MRARDGACTHVHACFHWPANMILCKRAGPEAHGSLDVTGAGQKRPLSPGCGLMISCRT